MLTRMNKWSHMKKDFAKIELPLPVTGTEKKVSSNFSFSYCSFIAAGSLLTLSTRPSLSDVCRSACTKNKNDSYNVTALTAVFFTSIGSSTNEATHFSLISPKLNCLAFIWKKRKWNYISNLQLGILNIAYFHCKS